MKDPIFIYRDISMDLRGGLMTQYIADAKSMSPGRGESETFGR